MSAITSKYIDLLTDYGFKRVFSRTGVFHRLYSTAEVAALSTRERNLYERSLKNYRDILADKETTRNRLIQERIEGRDEERAFLLAKLREKGMTDEEINELLS